MFCRRTATVLCVCSIWLVAFSLVMLPGFFLLATRSHTPTHTHTHLHHDTLLGLQRTYTHTQISNNNFINNCSFNVLYDPHLHNNGYKDFRLKRQTSAPSSIAYVALLKSVYYTWPFMVHTSMTASNVHIHI